MNLYESITREAEVKEYTDAEIKEFAEGLDLTPVFQRAEQYTGTKLEFTKTIEPSRECKYEIEFQSNDIKESCGVFGKILQYCYVDNFSTWITVDKDTGSLRYYVQVHLSYKHVDGGMNGMKLFAAQFMDGKWTFSDEN